MTRPVAAQAEQLGSDLRSQSRKFLRQLAHDRVALVVLIFLSVVVTGGLLAPWIAPFDPYAINLRERLLPPNTTYWFGTDEQGRDILSRSLFGIRLTLLIGFASVLFGGMIGSLIGIFAAFYQRLDGSLMRLMDVLFSFPAVLIGLAIGGLFGPGIGGIVFAVSIATIPPMARIARGSAVTVIKEDYVVSGRAIGLRDPVLIWRYVARNCVSSIFVYMTLRFGQVILLGSSLSFLGLGAMPPTAELGVMASQGRLNLFIAPHVALIPSLVIFATVLAFNLLGDALRDILDPRLQT